MHAHLGQCAGIWVTGIFPETVSFHCHDVLFTNTSLRFMYVSIHTACTERKPERVLGSHVRECELCAVNLLPGEHDVGVGVTCAGACGAPLDSVDFFTVSLEVVDTRLLLHTPNLCRRRRSGKSSGCMNTNQCLFSLTPKTGLTFKVMSSEQEARSIPDGSHLMALTSFCKTTPISTNVEGE